MAIALLRFVIPSEAEGSAVSEGVILSDERSEESKDPYRHRDPFGHT